ncbi:uncharacterized protein LOC105187853 isoform X2 [Harpegnathos saltator]|uniref:Uncharacterized protein n=1 Tax=Harpegnathos saltator TaxID=610380 RepID=E2BY49_HARSA|nr:uncharacterized protein LOC105187853 isoform X2 [Harpegnathos saltator]EFN79328.1 hypothetical protein EAI_09814 [Harpegnathos saltator]
MTFKSLVNLANFGKPSYTSIERYHNEGSGYHYHGWQSSSSKGKGGSGAALSALTLLAFLFLINVMQQSLQDNNSTSTTTTTAVLLRDTELPIILDNGEDKDVKTKDEFLRVTNAYDSKTMVKDRM